MNDEAHFLKEETSASLRRKNVKTHFVCRACGVEHLQWSGQCPDCKAWNSLEALVLEKKSTAHRHGGGYTGSSGTDIGLLSQIEGLEEARFSSGLPELDRVLGGGVVQGAVVLMGGDPGIGKSTLLLQALSLLSASHRVLYITGEESREQVKLRAVRLGLSDLDIGLLTETCVESMIEKAQAFQPQVMVVDSIQTLYTESLGSAPGSVAQVRESAGQLVRFAKQRAITVFLVGHVTKEGALAGPRVLEHMVDTVLYFEGDSDSRFRLLRAIKNRFGAVNELGVFGMTDKGLKTVSNPSAIFLSKWMGTSPGSTVMVTWEGSRPLLVEVQALVDESHLANPRRVAVGLDANRLSLILAVLHRHGGVFTYNQDVFVNIVGGVRVSETASDLPLVLAVLSSLKSKALPAHCVLFGEIGLAGEIRPVQSGQERLREAAKHGFKRAIVATGNVPKDPIAGMVVQGVQRLQEAVEIFHQL